MATQYIRGACKCCCNLGAVVARWKNTTMVATKGNPGVYSSAPCPRFVEGQYNLDNGSTACSDIGTGACAICGSWLNGGDTNGLSAQNIEDTVDDIMTCAASDATHVANDHNCYANPSITAGDFEIDHYYKITAVGSTDFKALGAAANTVGVYFIATGAGSGTGTVQELVDMRTRKLFGFSAVLARKNWHGGFGWLSNDACAKSADIPADQTKYLTLEAKCSLSSKGLKVAGSGSTSTLKQTAAGGFKMSIARLSGIATLDAFSLAQTAVSDVECQFPAKWNVLQDLQTAPYCQTDIPQIAPETSFLMFQQITGFTSETISPDSFDYTNTNAGWSYTAEKTSTGFGVTQNLSGSINVTRSGTTYTWTAVWSYTTTFSGVTSTADMSYSGSITLSNPYTSALCYADYLAALQEYNLSDLTLGKLRTDGQLANAPLIIYDEVGPTSPVGIFSAGTMNDYSGTMTTDVNGNAPGSTSETPGQHDENGLSPDDPCFFHPVDYIITWPQIGWIDPNNYLWKNPSNGFADSPVSTGGNIFKSPLRDGSIISHTQAGSDPHFWFNFPKLERRFVDEDSDYQWFSTTFGGYPDSALPAVSMRWMNLLEAQYDPFNTSVSNPPPGNYPMMFWSQYGGIIRGGKYIQATQKWKSVNCGRPCGPDRFSVDQTTVCCVKGGDAGSGFEVWLTRGVSAPPVNGAKIMVGGTGIYTITGVTDDGSVDDGDGGTINQWTINVSAKLDDIPTGEDIGDGYLGTLRFPTAGCICGRAAITTSYSSETGLVTILTSSQPFVRTGDSVDVCNSAMSVLATLTLTRVDDGTFTATHAAIIGAVFMVNTGGAASWKNYDDSPKRTGVHVSWNFNQRAAMQTTPPSFYGGINGCTGATVTQFNYDTGACRSIVGIVPFNSPPTDSSDGLADTSDDLPPVNESLEFFQNQKLFDFQSAVIFDDVFGNHGQGAIFLTMPDPFYQTPFVPECGSSTFQWTEDDGTSQEDSDGPPAIKYYPHHPLVEAASVIPSGMSLPSGITLTYDPANAITPPFYANGIPVTMPDGSYGSYTTDWVFALNVCSNTGGRFYGNYSYVDCTVIP